MNTLKLKIKNKNKNYKKEDIIFEEERRNVSKNK